MKKVFSILGIIIVLILCLLILVPYLFKDEIKDLALESINKEIDGEFQLSDVDLSLIRSFPNLRLSLHDVILTSDLDTTSPLLKSDEVILDLDLMSVIKSSETVKVLKMGLERPFVYVSVDTSGKANYNLFKSDQPSQQSDTAYYDLEVEEYWINDGVLTYKDELNSTYVSLSELQHTGSGRFTGDVVTLETQSSAKDLSIGYEGVQYANQASLSADIDMSINTNDSRVTLLENDIEYNQLKLSLTGWMQFLEDRMSMDLIIQNPSNDFGDLWSAIPPAFKTDYKSLQTHGNYTVNGTIKGDYIYETGELPSYSIDVSVDNGMVSYDELPQKLEKIFADLTIYRKNNSRRQHVNLRQLDFNAGQSYARTRAQITQTASNTSINGFADLDLNLEDLPSEGGYTGQIVSDVKFSGSLQDIERSRYDQIELSGTASLNDVEVDMAPYPSVSINAPEMNFSPELIQVSNMNGLLGKSDFSGSLTVADPLNYFAEDQQISVKAETNSDILDVNEWMSVEGEDSETESVGVPSSFLPLDMLIDWNGRIGEFTYEDYILKGIEGGLTTNGESIQLEPSEFTYEDSEFRIDANLNNIPAFMANSGIMTGALSISGGDIDLNAFMEEGGETTSSEESEENIVVPENMNLDIKSNLRSVKYGEMVLEDLKGDLKVVDQTLVMEDVTTKYLGGKMSLVGEYISDGIKTPAFNLKYDVLEMPFGSIAKQIELIDQFIPIAKYIEGIFNSTLVLEGNLSKGMMPDLSSLTASGYIETLKGSLGKIPFLEKVSKAVSVDELKGIALENTKNWFEIRDGKFFIQPFDYTYQDMTFTVSGFTSLEQKLDLDVKAVIPKEKFDELPGGQAVNQGMKWLSDEINKKGIPVAEVKAYTLGIDLLGAVNSPDVKVKLLDFSKQSLSNRVQETKEEIKTQVRDTLEKKKEEVIEKAKDEIEKKKEELQDTVKKRVEEEVKKKVDEVSEEIKKKAGEKADSILQEKGGETIDKIKDKLKDFKIFKKK